MTRPVLGKVSHVRLKVKLDESRLENALNDDDEAKNGAGRRSFNGWSIHFTEQMC